MPVYDDFERWSDPELVVGFLEEYFGLDGAELRALAWWRRPGGTIWASAPEVALDGLTQVQTVGMAVMRMPPPRGLPSSAFLRRFAQGATRQVVTLDAPTAASFVRGEVVPVPTPCEASPGMVVVRVAETVLGRGRIREDGLHPELPREARQDLGDALTFAPAEAFDAGVS